METLKTVDIVPMMWAVITVLAAGVWFFIKMLIKEVKAQLNGKMDKEDCVTSHEGLKGYLHKHSKSGTAGEVVEK